MMQPTRTNLLLLRERLVAVDNCTTILKGRRQALIKEFLKITRPLLQSREALRKAYRNAIAQLQVTRGIEGDGAVTALAAASRRDLAVEVKQRNLLGLRYRDVTRHETVRREFRHRDYDDLASTAWMEEAVFSFEEIVEDMLELAGYEGKFRRLAEELVRLTRRIRVLEERVAPDLKREIHAMNQYMAERERETYFRLKRFKNYASKTPKKIQCSQK